MANSISHTIREFKASIEEKIELFKEKKDDIGISTKRIDYYKEKFDEAFEVLKEYNYPEASTEFFKYGNYFAHLDHLAHLGIWDDYFTNDPEGKKSALGPLFLPIQMYKRQTPIGIIQAAKQQLGMGKDSNLVKAQRVANEICEQFMTETKESESAQYLPFVQLVAGGDATFFTGLPGACFIGVDESKDTKHFYNFSAVPHECGHVLAHTPQGEKMIEAIKEKIGSVGLNYLNYWEQWVEECFADAVAVSVIGIGEIYSLATLFSSGPTNKIYMPRRKESKKNAGNQIDEHPIRHIRVLLAVKVCRLLFADEIQLMTDLDKFEEEWEQFGERVNNYHIKCYPVYSNMVYDESNGDVYLMQDFNKDIEKVADALVSTTYTNENGEVKPPLKEIFSEVANKRNASGNEMENKKNGDLKDELKNAILKSELKWGRDRAERYIQKPPKKEKPDNNLSGTTTSES
jgi:hypothetical protein